MYIIPYYHDYNMNLHFFTKEGSPFHYDATVELIEDIDSLETFQLEDLEDVLNQDDVLDALMDFDWMDLIEIIDAFFDKTTNGQQPAILI